MLAPLDEQDSYLRSIRPIPRTVQLGTWSSLTTVKMGWKQVTQEWEWCEVEVCRTHEKHKAIPDELLEI